MSIVVIAFPRRKSLAQQNSPKASLCQWFAVPRRGRNPACLAEYGNPRPILGHFRPPVPALPPPVMPHIGIRSIYRIVRFRRCSPAFKCLGGTERTRTSSRDSTSSPDTTSLLPSLAVTPSFFLNSAFSSFPHHHRHNPASPFLLDRLLLLVYCSCWIFLRIACSAETLVGVFAFLALIFPNIIVCSDWEG